MSFLDKFSVQASASPMVQALDKVDALLGKALEKVLEAKSLANPKVDDKDFIKTLPEIEKFLKDARKAIFGYEAS